MQAFAQGISHSPIIGYFDPPQAVMDEIHAALAAARRRLADYDPELIIIFMPDHLNGFFYDLMPCFCLCMQARCIGDYETPEGELPIPQDVALECASFVVDHGIDLAVSYRMDVDHGIAQPLEQLFGGIDRVPIIPIFINGITHPLPTFRRARKLGAAVGRFARMLGRRTLFIGTGGLSHEPPIPRMETAQDPAVREFLLGGGRGMAGAAREARSQRIIDGARRFFEDPQSLHPLNPLWDQNYLNLLEQRSFRELDRLSNAEVTRVAGGSTHESKVWLAAFAALAEFGAYEVQERYYRAINEWIIGYGMMTASTR